MSENRFLQSFCALIGAATLVCGTHLFLLATADWDSATLEVEPPAPAPSIAIELSTGSTPTGPVAQLEVAPETPTALPAPQPEAAEETSASAQDEPPTAAALSVGDQTPLDQEKDAAPIEPAGEGQDTIADATPEANPPLTQSPAPVETTETGAHEAGDAVADSDSPLEDAAPPAVASEDLAPVPEQNAQAPSPQQAEATEPQEKVGDGLERTASILTTALEAKPEQPGPQVPLPQRAPRPAVEKPAPKFAAKPEQKLAVKPEQKLAAKLEQKPAAKPEQKDEKSPEAAQQWKPMALAPADKPSASLTQGQPKRLAGASYNAKIWSALARHKPNAGERGSTTVTFAIGSSGALRFVRVSQSSGNSRLDQLALATVRGAAPFPPPPAVNDAAYTIRIDFH